MRPNAFRVGTFLVQPIAEFLKTDTRMLIGNRPLCCVLAIATIQIKYRITLVNSDSAWTSQPTEIIRKKKLQWGQESGQKKKELVQVMCHKNVPQPVYGYSSGLLCTIWITAPHGIGWRKPPKSRMLCRSNKFVKTNDKLFERQRFLNFLQPSPQTVAVKRSRCSVLEQMTRDPLAKRSVRAITCVEMTPKLIPDPCVAVVTTPPKVWSEMEPTFVIAKFLEASCL